MDVLDKVFLEDYKNWYLNNDVKKALRFRPESARDELRAKAEAYRVRTFFCPSVCQSCGDVSRS